MNIRDEQRLVDAVISLARTNVEVKGIYEKFHADAMDRIERQYQGMAALTKRLVEIREEELKALTDRRRMEVIRAKHDIVVWQSRVEYMEARVDENSTYNYDKSSLYKDIAVCKAAIQCVYEQYPELAPTVGSD